MKYLKSYESKYIDTLKVGDYVIVKEKEDIYPPIREFTSNNIGRYLGYSLFSSGANYVVGYKNTPKELEDKFPYTASKYPYHIQYPRFRRMFREEIIHWSKDIKDLEICIQTDKYNL